MKKIICLIILIGTASVLAYYNFYIRNTDEKSASKTANASQELQKLHEPAPMPPKKPRELIPANEWENVFNKF